MRSLGLTYTHCTVLCLVAQSCLTPCDPIDFSLPGISVHGVFHAIILEYVDIHFSKGSSPKMIKSRYPTQHIAGWFFTIWATREAQEYCSG